MTGMIPVTKAATNDSVYLSNPQVADYTELNEAWMKGAETGRRVGMEFDFLRIVQPVFQDLKLKTCSSPL
jgi:hypothetical protein